jgi:hypothetical protein
MQPRLAAVCVRNCEQINADRFSAFSLPTSGSQRCVRYDLLALPLLVPIGRLASRVWFILGLRSIAFSYCSCSGHTSLCPELTEELLVFGIRAVALTLRRAVGLAVAERCGRRLLDWPPAS